MAKAKDKFVATLNGKVATLVLVNPSSIITMNKDGKLIFNNEEIGEIASQEVVNWAMQTRTEGFVINPPVADTKVSLSVIGSFGPKSIDVVVCTKIQQIVPENDIPQKKVVTKKIVTLEFKGPSSVNPGKVPLIDAVEKGNNPKVTFTRNATNEIELKFNGALAGKTKLSEDIKNVDWDALLDETVKSIKAADMKIFVDIEVSDEEKIDYTSVFALGEAVGMTKEEIQERIDDMANSLFMTKIQIEKVASRLWKKVSERGLSYIPKVSAKYVDSKKRELFRAIGYYADNPNLNLRLVGIQSTGKNTLLEHMAWLCRKPMLQLSCSRETTREDFEGAVTLGHKTFKRDKAELEQILIKESFTEFQSASMKAKIIEMGVDTIVQVLEFVEEPILIAAREGWWVLLDEFNLAPSSVLSRFHSLFDQRREITVPKLGVVKAVDGFAVVATMNPNSFVGASNMNQALESRFQTITLEARQHIDDILYAQCHGALKSEVKILDDLWESIFTSVQNEKIPDSFLSIRSFITALSTKGFSTMKERVTDNIAYISVNEPDANKIVIDIIDSLF